MAKTFEDKLPRLWEAIAKKLIDEHKVVNRLEELLREYGITEKSLILDVAGGYGFPSIELAKRGYQIVYNDGSWVMFQYAFQKAEQEKVPGYLFALSGLGTHGIGTVPWQEFNEFDNKMWDTLICRGNSLPYVASWGKEKPNLKTVGEDIKKVLYEFHRILTPNGILYVDKQPESQEEETEKVGLVEVDDKKLDVTCKFKNDKKNRIRYWTIIAKDVKSGKTKTYPSEGYLLLEEELVNALKEVGFRKVEKRVLEGDMYEGFVAVK